MINKSIETELIWISTDCEGQIAEVSRGARELLGIRGRGHSLSRFFPAHAKQMAFDMEVALTGWPGRRLATVAPESRRPIVVEYFVCARFTAESVKLYWFFDLVAVGTSERMH